MGRGIVKLNDGNQDWYLEWSTVVDAPVTNGMSLDEFQLYYKELYGTKSLEELPTRLQRCDAKGTTFINDGDLNETIFRQ